MHSVLQPPGCLRTQTNSFTHLHTLTYARTYKHTNTHIHTAAHTYIGLAITVYIYTVYDRIFGGFPAKNTVHKPYKYGSGQPYTYTYLTHIPVVAHRGRALCGSGQPYTYLTHIPVVAHKGRFCGCAVSWSACTLSRRE